MNWTDQVQAKEDARQVIARDAVGALHNCITEMEHLDNFDELLTYLAVVSELVNTLTIAIRSELSRRLILKDQQ